MKWCLRAASASAALWLGLTPIHAQTPVAQTVFWWMVGEAAGETHPEIVDVLDEANESKVLTPGLLNFLLSPSVSAGAKLALVNALYFSNPTAPAPDLVLNSNVFIPELIRRLSFRPETMDLVSVLKSLAMSDELMVLGYMVALENHWDPERALTYLEEAVALDPQSLAKNVALSLVQNSVLAAAPVAVPGLGRVTVLPNASTLPALWATRLTSLSRGPVDFPAEVVPHIVGQYVVDPNARLGFARQPEFSRSTSYPLSQWVVMTEAKSSRLHFKGWLHRLCQGLLTGAADLWIHVGRLGRW